MHTLRAGFVLGGGTQLFREYLEESSPDAVGDASAELEAPSMLLSPSVQDGSGGQAISAVSSTFSQFFLEILFLLGQYYKVATVK